MRKVVYNRAKDLHPVDGISCGIDLRAAYVNNAVPSNISGGDVDFNDVESPDGIMTRPSDTFEAYRQKEYVQSALKGSGSLGADTTPKGEN